MHELHSFMIEKLENVFVSCNCWGCIIFAQNSMLSSCLWPLLQTEVDLFASQPANLLQFLLRLTFFFRWWTSCATRDQDSKSDPPNTNVNDPFAAVPMNNFDGSDLFGAFTCSSNPASTESTESPDSLNNVDGESLASSNPRQKEGFQMKSGMWADSLSRGLIDLNISAR